MKKNESRLKWRSAACEEVVCDSPMMEAAHGRHRREKRRKQRTDTCVGEKEAGSSGPSRCTV